MPRIRIEFSKGDRVRFLSHLDLVKTFERAVRHIDLPIAYSEGFNPHPKMNFASALALGVVSDREYLDIDLKHDVDLEEITRAFSGSLPPGIEINRTAYVADNGPALMGVINRAEYTVTAFPEEEIDAEILEQKIHDFMQQDEIIISKWSKKGHRQKNIRPGILAFSGVLDGQGGEKLVFSIRTITGSEGNIRPEEVVSAFETYSGLPIKSEILYIRRTRLYFEKDGVLLDPMDV